MSRDGGLTFEQRGMQFEGRTKIVFVGNLPYDATEEEVVEIFRNVGPVFGFRMVYEATGKSKGFGFCEFYDTDVASSAVRNLNGVARVRDRRLRVDFAQPDARGVDKPNALKSNEFGMLPPGQQPPQGQSATDAITNTIGNMPPQQLLDIMSTMKGLVASSPDQARQLLGTNPQLSYALFQAMLLMNIVDQSVAQRLLAPMPATVPPGQSFPQPQQPPQRFPPQPQGYNSPNPHSLPPNPTQQPPQAAAPSMGGLGNLADPVERQKLVSLVMGLTPQQLAALPPEQRMIVEQIRAAGVGR